MNILIHRNNIQQFYMEQLWNDDADSWYDIFDIIDKIMSVKRLKLFPQVGHVKLKQIKMFNIQHSKQFVRILKIMGSLVDMSFSIVIMTSSDCGHDRIKRKKIFEKFPWTFI